MRPNRSNCYSTMIIPKCSSLTLRTYLISINTMVEYRLRPRSLVEIVRHDT